MPLPSVDTVVTYPAGDTASTGVVLHVEPLADGRSAVLLDRTAFHPIDTAWPDQPADRGALRTELGRIPVVDGVTGGILDGTLALGRDLPVRTGTAGWTFVVAHVIEDAPPQVGDTVHVEIDEAHRAALSAGHTGCHLASLALDAALADAWTKPAPTDPLGHPAFDSLAIQSSRIEPNGSVDVYRIGKSLRRKGFNPAAFADPGSVGDVAARANALLADWVTAGGSVRIERDGDGLSDRRRWTCDVGGHHVAIPCGGTHADSLESLGAVTVALDVTDVEGGLQVTMRTAVAASSR
ncbi:metal-dependent hydrolase [Agromyces sp. MMS24-JH15]|uniref:metal-dependent hydrolase n=1 Tax=Agromyces sp. MMS24-JH15 TaxID=3243765 RepID=UPI00374815DD